MAIADKLATVLEPAGGRAQLKQSGKSPVTWAVSLLLLLTSGFAFGGPGVVLAVIGSIIWLAWRFDNAVGTFLVLVVLLLIALAVLAMLLALMTVTL